MCFSWHWNICLMSNTVLMCLWTWLERTSSCVPWNTTSRMVRLWNEIEEVRKNASIISSKRVDQHIQYRDLSLLFFMSKWGPCDLNAKNNISSLIFIRLHLTSLVMWFSVLRKWHIFSLLSKKIMWAIVGVKLINSLLISQQIWYNMKKYEKKRNMLKNTYWESRVMKCDSDRFWEVFDDLVLHRESNYATQKNCIRRSPLHNTDTVMSYCTLLYMLVG